MSYRMVLHKYRRG